MDSFCFIVFSHANTIEKDNILNESLLSIKKTGVKIILASHLPVSERNQDICDYFIKDTDNLILGEDDIFNNPSDITDNTYSTVDYMGGFRFETSVYKKNYQAGVFNLLINSFNLAKNIGFKNAIIWDYDYILGDESIKFIKSSIDIMEKDKLESISFQSKINIFNNDIVQKEISCCYAVPVFVNIDKLLSIFPKKAIKSCKEYIGVSKMMIFEQWVKSNVINNCEPRLEYWYNEYSNFFPDTSVAKIDFQAENYLFRGLRSGLYFSEDLNKVIFCTNNNCSINLNTILEIKNINNEVIYTENKNTHPYTWTYSFINQDIIDIFNTDSGCKVIETVTDINSNKTDVFEYIVSKHNIDFLSKLKKFSIS